MSNSLKYAVAPKQKAIEPLDIVMDLREIVFRHVVEEDAKSGLIRAGGRYNENPDRPNSIMQCVKTIYAPLGGLVNIRLLDSDGKYGDRFLRVAFSRDAGSELGGRGATGITRSKLEEFTQDAADVGKPVTAYVYEGIISNQISIHLQGVSTNFDKLFATFVAHELGHNLGLGHTESPMDVMFVYGDRPDEEKKTWLQMAQNPGLKFSEQQIVQIKTLLAKP